MTFHYHERALEIEKEVKHLNTMATQGSKDEEVYKREYRRIKSLVSSSYIRQTSVRYKTYYYF